METVNKTPETLIKENLGFVVHIAMKYRSLGIPMEDLISEGRLGLVEAAKRYIPGKNCSFTTYAAWWVRKSILAAVSRDFSLIRIPEYHRKKLRRENPGSAMDPRHGATPHTCRTEPKWFRVCSLDDIRNEDDHLSYAERIPDQRDHAEDSLLKTENVSMLQKALDRLTAKEREILVHRYGLSGNRPKTLSELGHSMGISKERVRQIEAGGRQRIRRYINNLHKENRRLRMLLMTTADA